MDSEQLNEDDDTPKLSEHAMAALMEFYAEQNVVVKEEHNHAVTENWQLSQFWYDEITAETLAKEALHVAGKEGRIACISCPTLYLKLKEMGPHRCELILLEYDQRFQIHEGFIFYDYNEPLKLPAELEAKSCDVVMVDPPFLSEECLSKAAITARHLAKGKIILCTGAVMEDTARRELNVIPTSFVPHHTSNLANEFRCFVNYRSNLDQ